MDNVDSHVSDMSLASILLPKEMSYFRPIYRGASAAFCIQLFCIDEKHEARQVLISRLSIMIRTSFGISGPGC